MNSFITSACEYGYMETNTVIEADALEHLETLPNNSVHAIITDPPYGLAFMGRSWDDFEPKEYQEWCETWARKAKDVLKPGGHLIAFSGNRTHHRLFTGVEDAGFEIRDTLTWHYGSGFPKALDVSKEMDKYGGKPELTKEVANALKEARESRDISKTEADERFCGGTTNYTWFEGRPDGTRLPPDDTFAEIAEAWPELKQYQKQVTEANREVIGQSDHASGIGQGADDHYTVGGTEAENYDITVPATEAAKEWDGWKTALKPATEFCVLARKPLEKSTVAENIQAHGTGALNIDACRIPTDEDTERTFNLENTDTADGWDRPWMQEGERTTGGNNKGRYPANVIFDTLAAKALDDEVGDTSFSQGGGDGNAMSIYGTDVSDERGEHDGSVGFGDSGGPSRYFYTSKATKAERTLNGQIENTHPTVKPQDLIEWLVKLVTKENQLVLDPFAGSGTTGMACKNLNRQFILIEKQAKWCEVARARCGLDVKNPESLTDKEQQTLDALSD